MQSEVDGVAGAAPRDDPSVDDHAFGFIDGALFQHRSLEALEAGETDAPEGVQLREDEPGRGADGGDGAAFGIMPFHPVHQVGVLRQVAASGHAAGEDHHVFPHGRPVAGFVAVFVVCHVRPERHAVRRDDGRVFGDGNGPHVDAAADEDVPGGKGFHVFESVREKNNYPFHVFRFWLRCFGKDTDSC